MTTSIPNPPEERRHCGRCGHPDFTHATGRCTAEELVVTPTPPAVVETCTCQRTYDDVIGEAK